jgi:hypothetical protein
MSREASGVKRCGQRRQLGVEADLQVDVFAHGRWSEGIEHAIDEPSDLESFGMYLNTASLVVRQIQDIVDQPQEMTSTAQNVGQKLAPPTDKPISSRSRRTWVVTG